MKTTIIIKHGPRFLINLNKIDTRLYCDPNTPHPIIPILLIEFGHKSKKLEHILKNNIDETLEILESINLVELNFKGYIVKVEKSEMSKTILVIVKESCYETFRLPKRSSTEIYPNSIWLVNKSSYGSR